MNKLKYIIGALLIVYIVTLMLQTDNIDRAVEAHLDNDSHYTMYSR